MTPLERKMLEYAEIARKMNRLQWKKGIGEARFNREYSELAQRFKLISSDISKDIHSLQEELERIEVFFRIVSSYHEPWYKIESYSEENSKFIPKIIDEYVKKVKRHEQ